MIQSGKKQFATLLGFAAIFIWSFSIAVSRSLTEKLGHFTAGSLLFLVGGVASIILPAIKKRSFGFLRQYSPRYLLICGSLFVGYQLCFYLAIGRAVVRQQVLEVALIHYLWIPITILLSVLLLRKRSGFWLLPGIGIALAGILLANMQGAGLSLRPFLENLTKTPLPYIFALSCAFLWAFYSVLSNKFSEKNSLSGVPIFLLASGLALGICRLLFPEQSEWDIRTILEFVSYVVFTIIFGYSFWDFAMRKGNIVLVTALSYFIPLSSTILSSVYLKVPLTASLWAGSIMIILGALLCSLSVKDPN